jgi:uncharacterized protein (DUF1501 family)
MTAAISRRAFLGAGALAATAGATGPATGAERTPRRARSCILLLLVGGPSQLETFDPKPDAPAEVRGPFGAIATSVPGVRLGEHLPHLASLAHRYTLIRTVHHNAAPIHETGMQLVQTGRLQQRGAHVGASLAHERGGGFVILPGPVGNTGINIDHGQTAGPLGAAWEPTVQANFTHLDWEPTVQANFTHLLAPADRERYGKTAFGDACARAVQLVEAGTRCVVVNMFEGLYDRVTWDCHAHRQSFSSTLDDYRRTLCPTLDRACAALLGDLHERGLFDETLVLALGEMGRTPHVNQNGGRDHWTGCWSILMAGGGVRGGQVIGASDRLGATPTERPVSCPDIVASVYDLMGVPAAAHVPAGPRTLIR